MLVPSCLQIVIGVRTSCEIVPVMVLSSVQIDRATDVTPILRTDQAVDAWIPHWLNATIHNAMPL
jgi:hypothetical protein